ncbi:MAG: hypothetical protein ACI9LE_000556 [Paraglaciecola sp.]|jgi:hypothetical protein
MTFQVAQKTSRCLTKIGVLKGDTIAVLIRNDIKYQEDIQACRGNRHTTQTF